ncbi:MAG: GlxA family transcriptional regulator [Pseudorhodobacter sp.]
MTQIQQVTTIGLLVFPGFPMSCLTSMIEPLRAANEITGQKAFAWRILSETGERVESSADVGFDPGLSLAEAEDIDYVFLLSGPAANFTNRKASEGKLRHLARHGVAMGGVSGGVFPLARAGLLEGHECSVHWCYEAAFAAEFPTIAMRDEVIVFDRNRYTVSGAAAAFDLMLHFVEERLGSEAATEVACWFQHPLVRGKGVRQKIPTSGRDSTEDSLPESVAKAVEYLSNRLSEPVGVDDLAKEVGVSTRQLERLFKKATGQSPSRYYRSLRMKAARQLVLYSKQSLVNIALAVGYETVGPLQSYYRQEFGISPNADRTRINRLRVEEARPLPAI